IVGIAPASIPSFEGGVPHVYIPIHQREYFYPESELLRTWSEGGVAMYGRLRDGITVDVAREFLRATMRAVAKERREVDSHEWLEPLRARDNFMRASERTAVLAVVALLSLLTGLVLVVAAV